MEVFWDKHDLRTEMGPFSATEPRSLDCSTKYDISHLPLQHPWRHTSIRSRRLVIILLLTPACCQGATYFLLFSFRYLHAVGLTVQRRYLQRTRDIWTISCFCLIGRRHTRVESETITNFLPLELVTAGYSVIAYC